MPLPSHSHSSNPQSACAWPMAPMGALAAWRSGMAGAGAPCVMTAGTCAMPPWPAGSWAAEGHWPPREAPSSGRGQGLCGSASWLAGATRGSWASATTGAGRPTSAPTRRTRASSAQVSVWLTPGTTQHLPWMGLPGQGCCWS
uniref:cDNA FLJ35258 fis, clone PROST2004146 n=1 Tax=Homo sapiens TaxID=9606 RepID=Q8NAJ5_HUMAN|nr:unnamed protein product [Homo sapiens]